MPTTKSRLKKLRYQNIGVNENKVGKESRVKIYDKDKKMLQPDDVKAVLKELQEKFPDSLITIYGLNPQGTRNLKSGGGELMMKTEEDYYHGKVRDEHKFLEFYELHVTITLLKE